MAWEIRGAVPDFPVTIFVEIQTSVMSTGRTLFSRTPRSFFLFPLPIISAKQTVSRRIKFFAQLSFKKARFPFPPPPHAAHFVNSHIPGSLKFFCRNRIFPLDKPAPPWYNVITKQRNTENQGGICTDNNRLRKPMHTRFEDALP